MKVVAFASQKGGSGKTTLAGHIGVAAELAGHGPVGLIDTDPQGSLSDWWNARASETPHFVETSVGRLADDLDELRHGGMRLAVIDTPPAITSTIRRVIELSDLVILPTRPSPHDLRAAGATLEMVRQIDRSLVFVVNAATPRARLTAEAAIALSQHGTVAPTMIHHRTILAASMIDGRTAMEIEPKSKSAEEMMGLWQYLQSRLAQNLRRPATALLSGGMRHGGFGRRTENRPAVETN